MLLSVILLFFQLWGNVEVSSSQIECLTLPDVPHANISEETKRIDYQGGHVIHFTCEPGYNTSGPTIRYVCTSEGWLAVQQESCSPRSCGHPGEAPFADLHLEKGDDFVFGSQVVYTCNKGYQMVSRTKYRRCMSEGWDGVVPVCEAQQCSVIHVEQNVQVIGDAEEATCGNVVQFSCKSRTEILSGSQEMYCEENGEWRGQIPTCKVITCAVPEIENGSVPGDIPEYKEDEVLHFSCDATYKRTVDRPSRCTKQGNTAEWSPTPACEPIRCRLTLTLEGTKYQPSRNVFSPGDTVRVMCGNKYWISHRRGTSTVITCKEDGDWTLHPVCQAPLGCGTSPPLTDGDTTEALRFHHSHEERVHYRCQSYYTMEGEPYNTCFNGEWIGRMKCLKPCTVEREAIRSHNIEFRYGSQDKLYLVHNDDVTFVCISNRTPVDTSAMRCQCVDGEMHLPTCQ
ncbi:complement factor H-related protein 3-like isoform 1-T2 [Lycodopsis pacificus]